MRRLLWLLVLVVPVLIIVTLPARVVVPRLEVGENVRHVQGTLWKGRAVWRQPGFVPLDIDWAWDGGRRWKWHARGAGVDLEGHWLPRPGATLLNDVAGRVDIERLDAHAWLLNARPAGQLAVDIRRALVADGSVPQIDGRLVWENARLEGTVHESLGEVTVELEARPGQDSQTAQVASTKPGAVQVRGAIELGQKRYEVDLWLRASSDRSELLRQLVWLGEPQPDGQVRIRLDGGLGW